MPDVNSGTARSCMLKSLSNEIYIWNLRLERDQKPIAWNPCENSQAFNGDDCGEYFGKVFEAMQNSLKVEGLVFYFTRDLHELPSYGENVVAVVIGDEWSRIPTYFHKVGAVFKCYGTNLILGSNLLKPSYLNFLTLMQFIKAKFADLPGWLYYVFYKFKRKKNTPIYDIPLGYSNQVELPIKPINERNNDVFFAGSVAHDTYPVWSLKHWLETPKSLSRKQMLSSINKIKDCTEIKVELSVTPGFHASFDPTKSADARSYSEKMMDARICLAPRGTSFETFRFFEGMRYGCLVITEALPSRWFYDGCPAIQVDDWSELKEILVHVFEDKELLQKKHQESLNWWKEKCSEAAVGTYIAEKLNLLYMTTKTNITSS